MSVSSARISLSRLTSLAVLCVATGCLTATSSLPESEGPQPQQEQSTMSPPAAAPQSSDPFAQDGGTKLATFGAGCFWCVEAVFQQLKGVERVESGYSGGQVENPTYEAVCRGNTGHAEVCRITFDPAQISFDELLEVFWKTHDPTTLNRQGFDEGTQYRSVVFYHDEEQRQKAEEYKKKLDASGAFRAPLVTEIAPLQRFYPAEDYHQNYYRSNPGVGYCRAVIQPKLDKFKAVFANKIRSEP